MKKVNDRTFDISTEDIKISRKDKKKKKKKKSNFLSNLLTIIGVIGILVGGGILGTTLFGEYERGEQTKTFVKSAEAIVASEKLITREEFNPNLGDVVGLIVLPKNDIKVAIIEGTRDEDFHAGIGHEPSTGWPTDQRQIFLAGHRNTEFGVLEHYKAGDEVEMQMRYGTFKYRVTETKIVSQHAVEEIKPRESFEKDQLVLMTCYPFTFGADTEERFLVIAERI
ncbi:MAG: class D sortase [Culicoidibacterales bacterium]